MNLSSGSRDGFEPPTSGYLFRQFEQSTRPSYRRNRLLPLNYLELLGKFDDFTSRDLSQTPSGSSSSPPDVSSGQRYQAAPPTMRASKIQPNIETSRNFWRMRGRRPLTTVAPSPHAPQTPKQGTAKQERNTVPTKRERPARGSQAVEVRGGDKPCDVKSSGWRSPVQVG